VRLLAAFELTFYCNFKLIIYTYFKLRIVMGEERIRIESYDMNEGKGHL